MWRERFCDFSKMPIIRCDEETVISAIKNYALYEKKGFESPVGICEAVQGS